MPPPVNTNFSCRGRDTGFYADVETNCRVYHTCDDHGNKFTYYCPAETAFRQEALVCDHAHLVDCTRGRRVSDFRSIDERRETSAANGSARSPANREFSNAEPSLIEARHAAGRSLDVFRSTNSNPSYTRSFRITVEPDSRFSTPKSFDRKQPTFVLSSSVFLRDRAKFQKSSSAGSPNNRVGADSSKNLAASTDYQPKRENKSDLFTGRSPVTISSTTFRPFGADFKVTGHSRSPRVDTKEDNKMGGFFGNFESVTSTTLKPSPIDYQMRDDTAEVSRMARIPFGSQLRRSDAEQEIMNGHETGKFSSAISTTTFRPFGAGFKVKAISSDGFGFAKTKFEYQDGGKSDRAIASRMQFEDEETMSGMNAGVFEFGGKGRINDEVAVSADKFDARGFDRNSGRSKNSENARPSFFVDGSNFPYSETLRSMQAGRGKSSSSSSSTVRSLVELTTATPAVTAGTEFPVHALTGSLSPLIPNELEDDPYYPRRSTTTEAYYKLGDRDNVGNKLLRFSTRRPWPGSLDFEIPEVLPDLNTLDDLVDRRKHFYIPRIKAT